ncbi:MAG TPA: hypothetical protein DC034_10800 [Clostridium sp.]|nr:hypothetical protein [Clostridiales bacterium]HBC97265.1 hypothetical protein [Clostridium sp.]
MIKLNKIHGEELFYVYREWLKVLEKNRDKVERGLNELFKKAISGHHEEGKEGILTIDAFGNTDIYFEDKKYALEKVSKGNELEILRIDCNKYKNLKNKEDIDKKMKCLKNEIIPETMNKLYEDVRGWALEEG